MSLVSSSFEVLLLCRGCRFEKLWVRVEDRGIVHSRVAGSKPKRNRKSAQGSIPYLYHIPERDTLPHGCRECMWSYLTDYEAGWADARVKMLRVPSAGHKGTLAPYKINSLLYEERFICNWWLPVLILKIVNEPTINVMSVSLTECKNKKLIVCFYVRLLIFTSLTSKELHSQLQLIMQPSIPWLYCFDSLFIALVALSLPRELFSEEKL